MIHCRLIGHSVVGFHLAERSGKRGFWNIALLNTNFHVYLWICTNYKSQSFHDLPSMVFVLQPPQDNKSYGIFVWPLWLRPPPNLNITHEMSNMVFHGIQTSRLEEIESCFTCPLHVFKLSLRPVHMGPCIHMGPYGSMFDRGFVFMKTGSLILHCWDMGRDLGHLQRRRSWNPISQVIVFFHTMLEMWDDVICFNERISLAKMIHDTNPNKCMVFFVLQSKSHQITQQKMPCAYVHHIWFLHQKNRWHFITPRTSTG